MLEAITGEDPMAYGDPFSPEPQVVYLTRLRASIAPEAMDRDVILVPDQGGDVWNDYLLHAGAADTDADADAAGAAVAVLVLAVPWLGLRALCRSSRRRRRERS